MGLPAGCASRDGRHHPRPDPASSRDRLADRQRLSRLCSAPNGALCWLLVQSHRFSGDFNPTERNLMPEYTQDPISEVLESDLEPETQECDYCNANVPYGTLSHNEERGAVCSDCDRYTCSHCGSEWHSEDEAYDCCRYECPDCGTEYHYEDEAAECCRSYGASYPTLSDLPRPYQVSVPEIDGRPARVCSIEQEINDGGSEAMQMLYDFGFADSAEQSSYSSQGRPGMVTVKSDASLSGEDSAEIVYSRYRLWEPVSTADLSAALGRMRQLAREANVVRVNKSAGTHIHISAKAEDGSGIGPSEMAALHEIF